LLSKLLLAEILKFSALNFFFYFALAPVLTESAVLGPGSSCQADPVPEALKSSTAVTGQQGPCQTPLLLVRHCKTKENQLMPEKK